MSYTGLRLPMGAPPEGNKVIPLSITLAPGQVYSVGPVSEVSRISRIASILVDATKAFTGFELIFSDTQRRIVVPSGSESCHRTFSSDGAFTVRNLDAQYNAVFRAWLFTCPQPVYERFPGAALMGDVIGNAKAGDFANNPGGKVATYPYAAPSLPYGSVWDTALVTPNVTLSDGNLRATVIGPGAMRTVAYRGSGKYYFEAQIYIDDTYQASGNVFYGFANSAQGDGTQYKNYTEVLIDNHGAFLFNGTTLIGGNPGGPLDITAMGRIGFAVDTDNGLFWIRPTPTASWYGENASGLTTGDPVAGSNPFDLSALPRPWAIMFAQKNTHVYPGPPNMRLYTGNASLGGALTGVVPNGFQAGWPAL